MTYPKVFSTFLRGLELALIQLSVRDCPGHARKPSRRREPLGKEGLRGCLSVTKKEVNVF